MSEYTSTREGFQRAVEWSLAGSPKDAKLYAEATAVPTFYQVMNGQRNEYDTYVEGIATWRTKISDYKPTVYAYSLTRFFVTLELLADICFHLTQ